MTLFIGFYWEKHAKLMDTCLELDWSGLYLNESTSSAGTESSSTRVI